MESNFLSQFHKTAFQTTDTPKGRGKTTVLFKLTFERGATVMIIDEQGNPVSPDYKQ